MDKYVLFTELVVPIKSLGIRGRMRHTHIHILGMTRRRPATKCSISILDLRDFQ